MLTFYFLLFGSPLFSPFTDQRDSKLLIKHINNTLTHLKWGEDGKGWGETKRARTKLKGRGSIIKSGTGHLTASPKQGDTQQKKADQVVLASFPSTELLGGIYQVDLYYQALYMQPLLLWLFNSPGQKTTPTRLSGSREQGILYILFTDVPSLGTEQCLVHRRCLINT